MSSNAARATLTGSASAAKATAPAKPWPMDLLRRPARTTTVMAIRAEESVWFDAAYIGSRAALGRLDPDVLSTVRRSDTGRTLADHLTAAGGDVDTLQRGRAFFDPTQVAAYVEAH